MQLLNKGYDPIVLIVLYLTTFLSATVSIHALKNTQWKLYLLSGISFIIGSNCSILLRKIAANTLHLFDVRNF